MHVLLVEPAYYTRFPPLGLLKLSTYHKARGHTVELVRGLRQPEMTPDLVCVTSLFTYSWSPVHEAVSHYRSLFPRARIQLGGIYASLMPEHAVLTGAEIHTGLLLEAEDFAPDYSLVPGWDASILFSSRGCIRHCRFCSVPKIEPDFHPRPSIAGLVESAHRRIVLWDNNFLASPAAADILDELAEMGKTVDFNQGLDARLLTPFLAGKLARVRQSFVRIAYDSPSDRKAVQRAIEFLSEAGIRKKKIVVYVLFNFRDSPDDFLTRIQDLVGWDVTAYPMRFEPLNSLKKNQHVGARWTAEQLEMIADARRVLGYAGAWPPTEGLKRKFLEARSFEDAMCLREKQRASRGLAPSTYAAITFSGGKPEDIPRGVSDFPRSRSSIMALAGPPGLPGLAPSLGRQPHHIADGPSGFGRPCEWRAALPPAASSSYLGEPLARTLLRTTLRSVR